MSPAEWAYLILSIVFLLVCAFFSSAEIGFINLQRIRLKRMQEEGVKGADRVARILQHPEQFLSTVLTGVSFAETIVVSLGTVFVVALVGEGAGTPLAIVLIALILLVFAKVLPKTFAAQHPERVALLYGPAIEIAERAMHPIVIALSWIIAKLNLVTHSSTVPGTLISKEEIHTIISLGEEGGMVDEDSAEMLRRVFGLGERQVHEVMTPRTEVNWIEHGATLADFLAAYKEKQAFRYPVYENSTDNVKGILSIRDVMAGIADSSLKNKSEVTSLARPAYFVPGTKMVGELFSDMRASGYSMAIVLDEFGGSSGTVSIDQLIEEIVGEVREGLEAARKPFRVVGDHTFRIDGKMGIDEANREMALDLPSGDYKTVAGFALSLFGHLPREGEEVTHGDLKVVAGQVRDKKITRVTITRLASPEPEAVEEVEPAVEGDESKGVGPSVDEEPTGEKDPESGSGAEGENAERAPAPEGSLGSPSEQAKNEKSPEARSAGKPRRPEPPKTNSEGSATDRSHKKKRKK